MKIVRSQFVSKNYFRGGWRGRLAVFLQRLGNRKPIRDSDVREIVEVLELLLLAQLVRSTGHVWYVKNSICKWDFRFSCRWSEEKFDVLDIHFDLRDAERLIKTRMEHECATVVEHYLRRIRAK